MKKSILEIINQPHDDILRGKNLSKSAGDRSKEGSRGGEVIGHTGSGKPIYKKKDSYKAKNPRKATKQAHPEWNQNDHRQAATHHYRERLKAKAELRSLQAKNELKHGKSDGGMLSGGIHPDAHPDVKARMRELNQHANHHTDAADAHWGAGGGEGSRDNYHNRLGQSQGISGAEVKEAMARADKHFDDAHGSKTEAKNGGLQLMEKPEKPMRKLDSQGYLNKLRSHHGEGAAYLDAATEAVKDGYITGAAVVGSGYKNPKKAALAYLADKKSKLGKALSAGDAITPEEAGQPPRSPDKKGDNKELSKGAGILQADEPLKSEDEDEDDKDKKKKMKKMGLGANAEAVAMSMKYSPEVMKQYEGA